MTKRRKRIVLTLAVVAVLVAALQVGPWIVAWVDRARAMRPLLGTWRGSDGAVTIELRPGGEARVEFRGRPGDAPVVFEHEFRVEGDTLLLGADRYTFRFRRRDTLVITGNVGIPAVYLRAPESAPAE